MEDENKKDNKGFGIYVNHEGLKFGYGFGDIHIDSDGIHFGGLKL